MTTPAVLLNQLRIERDARPADESRTPARRVPVVAAIVVLAAGAAWIVADRSQTNGHESAANSVAERSSVESSRASTPQSTLRPLLDTSGYVVAKRQATVSSKTTGRVAEVFIEEGQRVEKDQIIARLDSSNASAMLAEAQARLAQSRADLDAARTARDDAHRLFVRNERLHASGLISSQAFDGARAVFNATESDSAVKERAVEVAQAQLVVAQRDHDDTYIRAPFSGVVTEKAAQPGEVVSPLSASSGFARTGIGTIVDMDSIEVEVDVSESFIARVHPGQPATVHLNAYPEWAIPAEAIAVIPTADRAKATVKVRVAFKEKDARILPDMGVKVSFLEANK